jgi:hypothetical protein
VGNFGWYQFYEGHLGMWSIRNQHDKQRRWSCLVMYFMSTVLDCVMSFTGAHWRTRSNGDSQAAYYWFTTQRGSSTASLVRRSHMEPWLWLERRPVASPEWLLREATGCGSSDSGRTSRQWPKANNGSCCIISLPLGPEPNWRPWRFASSGANRYKRWCFLYVL